MLNAKVFNFNIYVINMIRVYKNKADPQFYFLRLEKFFFAFQIKFKIFNTRCIIESFKLINHK